MRPLRCYIRGNALNARGEFLPNRRRTESIVLSKDGENVGQNDRRTVVGCFWFAPFVRFSPTSRGRRKSARKWFRKTSRNEMCKRTVNSSCVRVDISERIENDSHHTAASDGQSYWNTIRKRTNGGDIVFNVDKNKTEKSRDKKSTRLRRSFAMRRLLFVTVLHSPRGSFLEAEHYIYTERRA